MRKTVIAVVALFVSWAAMAQNTTVKGVVLDSLTREGEPAAILQFFRLPDADKPVAFTTTGENGEFAHTFTVKGDYTLLYSNMGRKEVRRSFKVTAGGDTVDLGEILAQDLAEVLKAGTVTAMRPLVKMEVDKMTYNVEDDVDSKTSTVLDMLRKVPMVSVDGQDNITVNGSSSFQVYVDGKPNQMISQNASTVFKMMPASAVKNIEVVTNPGVKYDAEGVGGVLNITTNRAVTGGQSVADGFYGTVRGIASNRGSGGGVYGAMQKGKFAMSLNLNAMYGYNNDSSTDVVRSQDNGNETKTHTELSMDTPALMGNLSASYEIDTLNLVSASLGLMSYGMRSSGTTAAEVSFPGLAPFSYDGTVVSRNDRTNLSAGADYQHLWADAPGRSLTFSYQLNASPSVDDSQNTFGGASITGLDLTDRKRDGSSNSVDNTFQADFTTPVMGENTVSTGVKYIDRHNSSHQVDYLWNGSEYAENAAGSLDYDYFNRIAAAYTELSLKFGQVGAKAGVRYEHTWQEYSSSAQANPFKVDYGSLVPTASLQWSPSMIQNIGLSYNMRISRPGISYLNPYVDTSDPTALSYGNTELEVERSHNISLVYNFYSPVLMINATLRHGFTGNGISQYSFYDENNLLNTTYGNIVSSGNTGLSAFIMLNPTNKTRIMINGGVTYTDIRSEALSQSNYGWEYYAMTSLQQTLPWDLRLSANLIAMGGDVSLQGYSTGMSIGMLGLTKTFFDDRLSLSVNAGVPFTKDFKMHISSYTSGNGFNTRMDTVSNMAQLVFQVSWTFGKQGNYGAKKVRRTIENEQQLNATSTSESMNSMMPIQ